MRVLSLVAVGVITGCGLDESGLLASGDGGQTLDGSLDGAGSPDADAAPVDTGPPQCATIDASCLGNPVPTDWTLVAVASGTAACPSADFDPIALLENPRTRADSCACAACTTQGSYTCGGFTLKTGSSCNSATYTKTTSPTCVADSQNGSVAGFPAAPTGTVTCSSSPVGTNTIDTDAVTGCAPNKCETDYCGAKSKGFATCIKHAGSVACPSGFTPRGTTGLVGTGPTLSCASCGCNVVSPSCTGTIRVFDNVGNCDGNGSTSGSDYTGSVAADGVCHSVGNFDSFYYVPGSNPTPSCTPSAQTPVAGDAGLTGTMTICCP